MDYCVRLIALATRELPRRQDLYPLLLVLLVAVKVRNPGLYRRFINGEARGAEVIDYFQDCRTAVRGAADDGPAHDSSILVMIEAAFYYADDHDRAIRQLEQLMGGVAPTPPLYVSRRAAAVVGKSAPGGERVRALHDQMIKQRNEHASFGFGLVSLREAIDLCYGMTRPRT